MNDILTRIVDNWEGYEGADISDYKPPVAFPVTELDIKNALRDAISPSDAFAHSSVYPNGPSPSLKLDGVGLVGLPLASDTRAQLIVDGSCLLARGTWRFPGGNVRVGNPGWDDWLKGSVLPQVYDALDIQVQDSAPSQLHLSSLILRTAAADAEMYTEEVPVDVPYVSLLVVLPTREESVTISFEYPASQNQRITFSTTPHSITVISFLPGATRTIGQAQAGNVIILEYQLSLQDERGPTLISKIPESLKSKYYGF
ncbi:hypothetical protein PQX77_017307, partial [Marasmius sp. AFHP31]